MEDNEGVQEKEHVYLGKLQYSIDYDFTQGEVCVICLSFSGFVTKSSLWT